MNIVLIPDSFKGTFTSLEVISNIKEGFQKHFRDATFIEIPIADGGEGTVEAIVSALKGEIKTCEVSDPLGRPITAHYGKCGNIAVIEMAEASGITKLTQEERNPLKTSTYGVGQLIQAALSHDDVEQLIIGIGGSATNDGGVGMLKALGVRFFDDHGQETGEGGQTLIQIKGMDCSGLDPRVKKMPITIMCDVTNPLTGPEGATMIYGYQKGANEEMLDALEQGMINYKTILESYSGLDVDMIAGAGAAGGLGAAFVAVLGSTLKPGIETILDLVQFDEIAALADLVITGEGKLDGQSIFGKVPVGVAKRCLDKKAMVVALVGCEGEGSKAVYDYGVDAIISTVNAPVSVNEVIAQAPLRLMETIETLCRLLKIGQQLKR